MGHDGACVYDNPDHDGPHRTYVVPPLADLDATRYWLIDGDYWRTNQTAPDGIQVECRRDDGRWVTDVAYLSEQVFLDWNRGVAREIAAEEVSDA